MLTFQVPLRTSEGVCGRRGAVDGLRAQSLRVKFIRNIIYAAGLRSEPVFSVTYGGD